jgi:hypothetical protein
MNSSAHLRLGTAVLAFAAGAVLPTTADAQYAQPGTPGKWQFAATIYAYLPSIGGTMSFPAGSGSSGLNVDASTIINDLKFTVMGSFDAHNGRWGMFTDVLYLDVGGSASKTREFSIGTIGLPATTTADLNLDLKGTVWTIAGEYRVASDPSWKVDLLAGARYFGVKPTLSWSIDGDLGTIPAPGRVGSKEIDENVWDGIVGVKGAYAFGADRRWSVPFYFDIGTGQSDLTWQAAAGIAYSYHWGDLVAMWRYVDYNFKSDKNLQDMNFNGPMFGATFRW